MLAPHARRYLVELIGIRQVAPVRTRAMPALGQRPRSRLRLLREAVDDQYCRPTLPERARDDFADLPFTTNARKQGEHEQHAISYRSPPQAAKLSAIGYRLSAIGYPTFGRRPCGPLP